VLLQHSNGFLQVGGVYSYSHCPTCAKGDRRARCELNQQWYRSRRPLPPTLPKSRPEVPRLTGAKRCAWVKSTLHLGDYVGVGADLDGEDGLEAGALCYGEMRSVAVLKI
jgi:hypothetical protein